MARLPCAVQPTVRVGVESAGLLSQPAWASPAYEAKLSPASAGLFLRAASDFRHRNQRLGWPFRLRLAGQVRGAMTMTNGSPSARRGRKFTPEAIDKIKELVAQGARRDEIAGLLGVTVGSLQVTCSRLGISLRRKILHSGPTPHLRDPNGRAIPVQGSVGVAYAREQKTEEVPQKVVSLADSVEIAIMMRRRGKEVSTDVPFTSRDIGELALIAMLRDLSIAELVGQALGGAIKKNMIKEILRDDVPSSSV